MRDRARTNQSSPATQEACDVDTPPVSDVTVQPSRISVFLHEFSSRRTLSQFIRYVTIGMISFTIEISLLYVFTETVKLWYIYANSIAYIVVFWLIFLLNRFWAFRSKADFKKQMFMTAALFVINLCAQNAMMYLLTDICHVYYIISKVFSVGLVASWNFILYKKVIYT